MFQAAPDDDNDELTLRASRIPRTIFTCVSTELALLVEIRAAQRTFEGAYMRTALGQFSFALIILKIFTSEFYAIGALFAVYGAAVMLVAIYRRYEGHRQFFTSTPPPREDPGDRRRSDETTTTGSSDASRRDGQDGRRRQVSVSADRVHQEQLATRDARLERAWSDYEFAPPETKKFRTSGNSVALLAGLSLAAYTTLLVLTWQLVN